MGPLVGANKELHIIALSPDCFDEPLINGSCIMQRLSILSDLRQRGKLKVSVIDQAELDNRKTPFVMGDAILVAVDQYDDAVCLNWEQTLDLENTSNIAFSLIWSFGDPHKTVKKTISAIDQIAKTSDQGDSSAWLIKFYSTLDTIEPATPPYVEDFSNSQEGNPSITLYPHQKRAIESWIENDRMGIFKMCTGSGKTLTSLFAIQEAMPPGGPILVTVPTRVLADQWVEQITRLGYDRILRAYESSKNWVGLLDPWLRSSEAESPRFVVTTYKTFSDERFLKKIDRLTASQCDGGLWIADEMHNLASTKLAAATLRTAKGFPQRIGLSATPEIEGDEPMTNRLAQQFGGIVASYDLKDGIDDGVLCRYRYHPIPAYLDPSRGTEYLRTLKAIDSENPASGTLIDLYRQSRELIRKSGVQLPALTGILEQLRSSGQDLRHTLVYCPPGFTGHDAEESDEIDPDGIQTRLLEDVVAEVRRNELSVSSILGETPKGQRGEILRRFSEGSIEVLCAIGCLDEGIDIPSIKRAIVLYSIDREKQFVQRRGRILRTIRGSEKTADIYDVVILPHGTDMNPTDAERLLNKELRRYRTFSDLALNSDEAHGIIRTALNTATEMNDTEIKI
jgi:superfamily II DNA or RNA helicase